ncbi:MAG: SRPBCC family protein [Chloroflexi bacterium]|nr:SRPBCC family protein [Chloroflexota bacterium]MDA1147159.1 SRPBCC family protein [Chloroflexota bacterium]
MPDAPSDGSDDGRLIDLGGRRAVRFTRRYSVSRAELWSAITDPDRMARWAYRGALEPRSGGKLTFDYGEGGGAEGTVLEWDEPSVLEYEWGTDTEMPWRIRFELTSEGDDGTLLTFDHFLPDPAAPEFAAGWHWHLDRLAMHLGGTEPPDAESDAHFDALLERYRAGIATEG